MTFNDHLVKASGYLQLELYQEAWDQIDEMIPEHRAQPQAISIRLLALEGLEKWKMGSEIAKGAVKVHPEALLLWVSGARHIQRCEGVDSALEFLLRGEEYLKEDGWYWHWLSCFQCLCGLADQAITSHLKALSYDEGIKAVALAEQDLELIRDKI